MYASRNTVGSTCLRPVVLSGRDGHGFPLHTKRRNSVSSRPVQGCKRGSVRVKSLPRILSHSFRYYCELCGTGSSMLVCWECKGEGIVLTKPGGAGVRFRMGNARCKLCSGIGVVPCPLCGGYEASLPPPDPDNGPRPPPAEDDHLSIQEWLAQFGGGP